MSTNSGLGRVQMRDHGSKSNLGYTAIFSKIENMWTNCVDLKCVSLV